MINFFSLDQETNLTRIVDLPGYGYAKVPMAMKKKWQAAMSEYLAERDSLRGIILLMDIRHPFSEFDEQMIDWADRNGMPLHILLTKSDKLKKGPAKSTLLKARKRLEEFETAITIQLFSAVKGDGLQEAREQIGKWLEL